MVGIKLLHLYRELNAAHRKELRLRCSGQADKRYRILEALLEKKVEDPEELIDHLKTLIEKEWPGSDDNEVKYRRISLFICEQFELVIIDQLVKNDQVIKNTLIAKAVEKRGNLSLIRHYYDKLYKEGRSNGDTGLEIRGLNGKIRMSYASQNENDLEDALALNEELLKVLSRDYKSRLADYYYHCSNIYLERNSLLSEKKERLQNEILQHLEVMEDHVNRASLYLSLAKFNYNNDLLSEYLDEANKEMKKVSEPNREYYDLDRKIRFLELRLHFFSGKDLDYLMNLSENVIGEFDGYSIINNNVLFYRILFTILSGDFHKANLLLQESIIFFQGESGILKQFLQALLHEREGETRKSIQMLNHLMYTDNYLVAIFSRLLYVRIQLKRDRSSLLKTTIDSAQRLLKKNKDNPLGKEGHEYVLAEFRRRMSRSARPADHQSTSLTVLHKYLLD